MSLETIYDYFEDHAKAAAYVQQTRPILLGVLCFTLGGLSFFLSQAMAKHLVLLTFSFSSLALILLWEIVMGFLLAAVLHMILDIQGVQGSATSLFVLVGLADLVWILAVPLVLIFSLVLPHARWPANIVFFFVGLLNLNLKARAMRDNYRITATRAWSTLAVPYLAVMLVVMLGTIFAVWTMFLRLVQMAR